MKLFWENRPPDLDQMYEKECTVCGDSFETPFSYHTMCKPCWKDYYRQLQKDAAEQKVELDASFVKQIISLVHPDRHPSDRFAMANEVTAKLLDILKKARGS